MVLKETVLLRDGRLEVELDGERYRLSYGPVEYRNGVRKVKNKVSKYAFRSIEQLRYDFERDVEAAGGRLG